MIVIQFRQPAVKDLEKEHMPKKKKKKGWFSWGRSSEATEEDAMGAISTAADSTALTASATTAADVSGSASSTTVTSESAEQVVR